MKKLNQFDTLVIDEFEKENFHIPTHSDTYYEIIYIVKASGIHYLNSNLLPYTSGDLFVIIKTTRFFFIKFTHTYLNSNKNGVAMNF